MKIVKKIICLIAIIAVYGNLNCGNNLPVKCGIDVLIENGFSQLKGKRVVLLTNHAGRTNSGKATVEAFLETKHCKLTALMTPEHGYYTSVPAGQTVESGELFGIPVFSLYGSSKSPAGKMLSLSDVVVIDIQDIGVRSYTYISTIYNVMKECAKIGKPIVILDRPNPLGGMVVDGNVLDEKLKSFVGIIPVAYIHGCTVGELAKMINEEGWLGESAGKQLSCNLSIMEMQGWERWMNWEDTGLQWFPTSPHVPSIESVRGIAVLGIIGELGVISIGIGTSLPFQYLGSPDFNFASFEKAFNIKNHNGITFHEARYRPFYGMYNGRDCAGYLLKFYPDNLFTPYSTGISILKALSDANPALLSRTKIGATQKEMFEKVTGTKMIIDAIIDKKSYEEIMNLTRTGIESYLKIREKYLIYPLFIEK